MIVNDGIVPSEHSYIPRTADVRVDMIDNAVYGFSTNATKPK